MGLTYNKGSVLHGLRHRPLDCQSKDPKRKVVNQMVKAGCAHNVPVKRLYSIKELATHIGATEWFWRSQIWDGQLPYVQVGRKIFIDREYIEDFIQRNKTQTKQFSKWDSDIKIPKGVIKNGTD